MPTGILLSEVIIHSQTATRATTTIATATATAPVNKETNRNSSVLKCVISKCFNILREFEQQSIFNLI